MKKNKKSIKKPTRITLFLLVIVTITAATFQACLKNDEDYLGIVKSPIEKNIKNGRFVFSSKESLGETIKNLQDKDSDLLEKEFEKLYYEGFRSHKPIVNSENEQLQTLLSEEILQKRLLLKGNTEEESDFILDPMLASLVNKDNEIIVNDSIYKFTKEKGLFYAHVKDSTHLFNYFKKNDDTLNGVKSAFSKANRISPCEEREMHGGYTQVDERITRYIRPAEEDCDSGGGGTSVNFPPLSKSAEAEKLQDLINSLPVCDGNAGGNWFQNFFGKSYVCRTYYNTRNRVKVEFWDQSWGFYKSVGALVKSQKRRLGIWWGANAEELYLGINRVYLKYNYKQPVITGINSTAPYKFPLYMYNGTFQTKKDLNGNFYVNTQIEVPRAKIPFFDFGNKNILNIYIPNAPYLGNVNINLTTKDLTSESNIKALYKLGIDFLKTKYNTGKIPQEFGVIYQKNTNEIEVLYFGERYKYTNHHKIKRKFYSDVAFTVSAAWGDVNNNWKFSVKPAESMFRNYTHYEIDFYGMARRGSTWRGNRMIR